MASQRTTFAELPGRKLELLVVCQKCGHQSVITGTEPKLQARPIAGQRFRCSVEANGVRCGGIGLPTMRTRADWTPPPRPPLPPIPPKLAPRKPGTRMTQSIDTSHLADASEPPLRKRRTRNWMKGQADR
jgi:hypothetical protein